MLKHSHARLSQNSHSKPLDVIHGLSVEAIASLFGFFFPPLAVMPVATKNENLAIILHLHLIGWLHKNIFGLMLMGANTCQTPPLRRTGTGLLIIQLSARSS